MKIKVTNITGQKIIPVAVCFKAYKQGESYAEQMTRIRNFSNNKLQGYVKQFYPAWHRDAMAIKRNQTMPTLPNEFIKEMN